MAGVERQRGGECEEVLVVSADTDDDDDRDLDAFCEAIKQASRFDTISYRIVSYRIVSYRRDAGTRFAKWKGHGKAITRGKATTPS